MHPNKNNAYVRMSKVNDRGKLSQKKKDIYNVSMKILKLMNSEWIGNNEDFILQVSCMDKTSYVEPHNHLSDVSTQHAITFGKYTGGMLNVLCPKTNLFKEVETLRTFKEFDGRSLHYVTPVSEGKRFSVLFFKCYDRNIL